MGKYSEVFVGIDTAKKKHAVAIADAGRDGETRYLGEIDSAPATVERVIKKVRVCYEAGPTGYGLYRQIITLGHECTVVAPSDSQEGGRPDQDQSTRCSDPGAVVSGGGIDFSLGP